MIRDLVNREKLRRVILYCVYIIAVRFLQDSVVGHVSLFGVNMMFIPAAAVAIGAFEGGVWGAAFGLVLGFLADISFGNVALFTVLFPILGFLAGVFTRWFVNASFFAYMVMCLAAFAVTAAAQMLAPIFSGSSLFSMLGTALTQILWSLPMAAVLYFPCRAIARRPV